MKLVGQGFEYPHTVLPIEIAKALPQVYHQYGKELPSNTGPLYWMAYKAQNLKGQIKFLRRLYLEYPGLVREVTDFMESIFTFKPDPARVNLLWTTGDILPHVDEARRKCALNIGVLNSSSAITHIHEGSVAHSYTCEDGNAYLLDTSQVHSVTANTPDIDRFLITYGFARSFDEVLSARKIEQS